MKAIVLTLSCSLLAASMVGMVGMVGMVATRGSSEGAGSSASLAGHVSLVAIALPTEVASKETAPVLYEPVPTASRVLAADETVRVIPLDVWRASLVMSDANRYDVLRACYCESRWQTDVVGLAGEQGACQVMARFHGPVPSDLAGQFAQADRIATAHGMTPWTTKGGCPEWNAS